MITRVASFCRRCLFLVSIVGVTACGVGSSAAEPITASTVGSVSDLQRQICALAPAVHSDEAERVADVAYATAAELRHEYRVVGPPLFHNFLVNTGIRKRGLCFQWAEDLLAQLDQLKLKTLELHWGEARARTWREHNCVVVTAKGQPFETGVILDCWRHSGHLYWARLAADHYPWIEDSEYARLARVKAAAINHPVALQMKVE